MNFCKENKLLELLQGTMQKLRFVDTLNDVLLINSLIVPFEDITNHIAIL